MWTQEEREYWWNHFVEIAIEDCRKARSNGEKALPAICDSCGIPLCVTTNSRLWVEQYDFPLILCKACFKKKCKNFWYKFGKNFSKIINKWRNKNA